MRILPDLESAASVLEDLGAVALVLSGDLLNAINVALSLPSPTGSPSAINTQDDAYAKASAQSGEVAADIMAVGVGTLPSAWKGAVAETAAQAVQALSAEVGTTQSVLAQASHALRKWAEDPQWAQSTDQRSCALLEQAKSSLGLFGLDFFNAKQALRDAIDGVKTRVAAVRITDDTGTSTASLLNQLANRARAERVRSGNVDALSAVVLATETNPGGDADGGAILTPNELNRASQRFDGMSAADLAAFEKLLADSNSPEEAAYLWKALAAGHTLAEITQFDAAIHPHGADPAWLAAHLTPDMHNPASGAESSDPNLMMYQGSSFSNLDSQELDLYDRGRPGDCVAASTVAAQAGLDPMLMLQLTTGGTANGDDSPAAFHQRLQQLYVSQYITGQQADGIQVRTRRQTRALVRRVRRSWPTLIWDQRLARPTITSVWGAPQIDRTPSAASSRRWTPASRCRST